MAKRIELFDNGVKFLEEPHEYWYGDIQLSGITSAITHQLQSARDEYNSIPEHMRERLIAQAGSYGAGLHRDISALINEFSHSGTQEVEDFRTLTQGWNIEASEYCVSDLEHWASNIDLVVRVSDNEFELWDFKSYSNKKLTKTQMEKVKFQLGIYRWLFCLQHPGAIIRNVGVIHICNKIRRDNTVNHIAEIVPVELIPTELCQSLLECELNGELFQNPFDIPKEVTAKSKRIIKLLNQKKEAEAELTILKKDILETMLFLDVPQWRGENITFTRVAESTRKTFDLAAFKAAFPDMDLTPYMKESSVAGSLKILTA